MDSKLSATVARLKQNELRYPPDLQEEAVRTVLRQAELLCADWSGEG